MRRILAVLILVPLILSSCWDQKIFEKIGFTLQIGVESSKKEGHILYTTTSPAIGAKDKKGIEMISTTADILREGRENAMRMASRKLASGKIQQVLFSEELSRKGLHDYLDAFERDPEVSLIAWVIVVEGSPHELISKASKFKDIPGPALYINQLIENNSKDMYVPGTRVYNFDIDYFAPGIDPITPLIRLEPNDLVAVGSALFSGDKMVGKIDHIQTAELLEMMGKYTGSGFSYTTTFPPGLSPEGKKEFAITFTNCKRKISVKIEDDKPVIDISLGYEGIIDEYGWDNLSDKSIQKKLEEHLSSSIKKECMEIFKYLQEVGSDPIGIGETVRAKYYDYWNSMDWKDAYKNASVNIDVKTMIKDYGSID